MKEKDRILLLDPSVGTFNLGDEIIMECCRKELKPLIKNRFCLTLPTHVVPFNGFQVWRNSSALRTYSESEYKFACGSNLLIPHLLTHYPQWNINLFNYKPLKGTILVGIGAGAGAEGKIERYTKYIYTHMLNRDFYHSLRDERSKIYAERLGLKAINTGCVTMWMLTPEHCQQIPRRKSDRVVFTITATGQENPNDQELLNMLLKNYKEVFFWPQGINDYDYFCRLKNTDTINVLTATKDAYDEYLTNNDTDYVGTRLHGGVYALRHKRRSIIIAIDERARSINADTNLPCIEYSEMDKLENMINAQFVTDIRMPFDRINKWKSQFSDFKTDVKRKK